jgi:hypothetical protein
MRAFAAVVALARVNLAFLSDPNSRRGFAAVLGSREPVVAQPETEVRTVLAPSLVGGPYTELTPDSVALVASTFAGADRHVNLVLPEVVPGAVFAGVKTALEIASVVATRTGFPIRVVTLKRFGESVDDDRERAAAVEEYLAENSPLVGHQFRAVSRSSLAGCEFGRDDIWIVTHWTTAHALDVVQRLSPDEVKHAIYLVQDYEPGFNPWSTDFAIARSTYHAGFVPIVNSVPLAEYLKEAEGLEVEPACVFSPSFDFDELEITAGAREPSPVLRIFFYGRPSKPRNLYQLGVAALRKVAIELTRRAVPFEVVMAGEGEGSVDLGPARMRNLGALARSDYFALLARTDIGLSLQYSPHPSHPPFDIAISGAQAITNEFGLGRENFHRNLHVAPADPDAIAAEILRVALALDNSTVGRYSPPPRDALGQPLADAVDATLAQLSRRATK